MRTYKNSPVKSIPGWRADRLLEHLQKVEEFLGHKLRPYETHYAWVNRRIRCPIAHFIPQGVKLNNFGDIWYRDNIALIYDYDDAMWWHRLSPDIKAKVNAWLEELHK